MAQELKAYSVVASSETQNYLDGEIHLTFEAYDANEVDAVLAEKDGEIRRLQRALWLARAERAIEKQTHFALCHNHSIDLYLSINGASMPTERHTTMRQPSEWTRIWKKVAIKCRAKAEQYK